jgi:hypothetical protein
LDFSSPSIHSGLKNLKGIWAAKIEWRSKPKLVKEGATFPQKKGAKNIAQLSSPFRAKSTDYLVLSQARKNTVFKKKNVLSVRNQYEFNV